MGLKGLNRIPLPYHVPFRFPEFTRTFGFERNQHQKNSADVSLSISVGAKVLRAAVMKSSIIWFTTQCNPLKVNGRFGGTRRFNLQGRLNYGRN
jgi:hypothetical protein